LKALVLAVLIATPAAAQIAADCGSVRILASDLREGQAMDYCKYAIAERAKVEAFWGPTWTDVIRIRVDAKYQLSRALVPGHFGNRGFMEMPLRRVTRNNGALLHEIVHIYAPHENRFLAEGFAVYLQAKLGGNTSLPNEGELLAKLARRHLPKPEIMEQLNAVKTPVPLGKGIMDDMTAYILAGSFVAFLIEKHDLAKFRVLYDGGSYEAAYGKPFAALEREWRGELK